MTFVEFEKILKKKLFFEKYFYGLIAVAIIVFMFYMLFVRIPEINKVQDNSLSFLIFIVILFGFYTLRVSVNIDKFEILKNQFPKEKNTDIVKEVVLNLSKAEIKSNYISFTYYKGFFETPYKVYLYADNNFIAINTNIDRPGIVDFGASKRVQNKIIKSLEKQYFSKTNEA